jgi:hypothetical protein
MGSCQELDVVDTPILRPTAIETAHYKLKRNF